MTVYAIISIVIALTGATFTAISHFSAYFGPKITEEMNAGDAAFKYLTGQWPNDCEPKKAAKQNRDKTTLWFGVWNFSGLPPIAVLGVFALAVAAEIFWRMPDQNAIAATTWDIFLYRAALAVVVVVNVGSFISKYMSKQKIIHYTGELKKAQSHVKETVNSQSPNIQPGSGNQPTRP